MHKGGEGLRPSPRGGGARREGRGGAARGTNGTRQPLRESKRCDASPRAAGIRVFYRAGTPAALGWRDGLARETVSRGRCVDIRVTIPMVTPRSRGYPPSTATQQRKFTPRGAHGAAAARRAGGGRGGAKAGARSRERGIRSIHARKIVILIGNSCARVRHSRSEGLVETDAREDGHGPLLLLFARHAAYPFGHELTS